MKNIEFVDVVDLPYNAGAQLNALLKNLGYDTDNADTDYLNLMEDYVLSAVKVNGNTANYVVKEWCDTTYVFHCMTVYAAIKRSKVGCAMKLIRQFLEVEEVALRFKVVHGCKSLGEVVGDGIYEPACADSPSNNGYYQYQPTNQELERWWGNLPQIIMERIADFKKADFELEDGTSNFVEACTHWFWNELTYSEQVALHYEWRDVEAVEVMSTQMSKAINSNYEKRLIGIMSPFLATNPSMSNHFIVLHMTAMAIADHAKCNWDGQVLLPPSKVKKVLANCLCKMNMTGLCDYINALSFDEFCDLYDEADNYNDRMTAEVERRVSGKTIKKEKHEKR